jgi:hypothetical protein
MKLIIFILGVFGMSVFQMEAQKDFPFRLSDTGQLIGVADLPGEDADYLIDPPSLFDNGNGTITDYNSVLM